MTTPPPSSPSGPPVAGFPPPAPTPASGARVMDVVASVILMVAGVIGFGLLAFMSLFLVMMSDACYNDRCNTGVMSVGWLIAMAGPPLVFVAAIVWTIIRLARRKAAWWLTLAGAAVGIVLWFIGVGLMNVGLGR
ncbi:DUF6264 family protein [Microbacterium dextranolyticum]|nr:DUF6264 family protein [Microbacterium dextranolyticum]MBM7461710.1 uncharacterized BrkB/YihY/UPF0761 family membrane protein [Microbacterium dextranolyticum]